MNIEECWGGESGTAIATIMVGNETQHLHCNRMVANYLFY